MPRPRADGKKPVVRTRGELHSEFLSGSCRTFADIPDNLTQTILRRMDPIKYNILRTGNWPVAKMQKQLLVLLNPKGDAGLLPTHHVPSLVKACLAEYIRRFPRKASAVEQDSEPDLPQANPKANRMKSIKVKKCMKKPKTEPARPGLGLCVDALLQRIF